MEENYRKQDGNWTANMEVNRGGCQISLSNVYLTDEETLYLDGWVEERAFEFAEFSLAWLKEEDCQSDLTVNDPCAILQDVAPILRRFVRLGANYDVLHGDLLWNEEG